MYNTNQFNGDEQFLTEAVFIEGKETVAPLLEDLRVIKDELMTAIQKQDDEEGDFNPKKFWRSQNFKKFEDDITQIFGFRNVQVQPYIEKYSSKDKQFESHELNCCVYKADRFPVEGLVTEKGFYDKSKSISMDIYITLGLIKILTPEELLAVLLHEFGHCIDPALITIKYTEVNILSKYLTDRKNKLSRSEQKYLKKKKFGLIEIMSAIISTIILSQFIMMIIGIFADLFGLNKKKLQKRINKMRESIKKDKSFNRTSNIEAYADNFARMYGYGAYLASSLKKMEKDYQKEMRSHITREKDRQEFMVYVIELAMQDVHKTDMHRFHSLMKEYKKDLDDPTIPDIVKKQIQEDMEELDKIVKYYINNFDDFQNNLNKIVHEELSKKDGYEDLISESTEDDMDDIMESYIPKNIKLSEDEINLINEIIPIIKEEMSTDCAKMEFIPMTQKEDLNNITKSKIGGVPYWPEDMKWPTEKGRPLILAIQINFAELPPEIKFNYPTSGIIQVFIDPNTYVSKFNSIPSISIFHQSTDKPQSSNIPASSFTITPKIDLFATCKLINVLPAKDIMNFNKESRIYYHEAMKNAAKKLNIDFKSTFIGNDNTGTPIYHALEDYFGSASDDDFNDFVNYVSDNVIAGYDAEYHMSPNLFTLSDFKSRTLIGAYYYPNDNHEVNLYQYDISGFTQNYSRESVDSSESNILDEVIDDDVEDTTDNISTEDKSNDLKEATEYFSNKFRYFLSDRSFYKCNDEYLYDILKKSARYGFMVDDNSSKVVSVDIGEVVADPEDQNLVELAEYYYGFYSFVKKYKNELAQRWPQFSFKIIRGRYQSIKLIRNINNDDEFTEKSHGKLKYDFRYVLDANTFDKLKIVYSLDNIKIDQTYDWLFQRSHEIADKKYGSHDPKTLEKNIKKDGNLDHSSSGQKVLAIINMDTGENLKEADCYPIIGGAGSRKSTHIKVGDIDTSYTYKSTFWPKHIKNNTDNIAVREEIGIGRGAKLNDVNMNRSKIFGPVVYNHPSKKDIKKNPELYNKESADIFIEAKLEIPDVDEDFKFYKDHGDVFDKSFEEASKFIANEYRKYLSTQDVPEWWTKGGFIDFNFLCNDNYIWIVSARVSSLESEEEYDECRKILQLDSFVNKYKSIVEERWPGCTIGVHIDEDYALYVVFDKTHFASDKLKDAGKKAYEAFSKYVTDAFEDEDNPMCYEYIRLDENKLKDSKTYHVAVYLRNAIEDDPWDLFKYYDLVPEQRTHEAWDESLNKVLSIINSKFNIDKALNIIKNSISQYNGINVETEEDKYGNIDILLKESSSFTESKSNNSARKKTKQGLTSSEYSEVHERFGDVGCSFAKDKDGYYCYTHRARSKSYPTIAEIPQDKVDFIVSTG